MRNLLAFFFLVISCLAFAQKDQTAYLVLDCKISSPIDTVNGPAVTFELWRNDSLFQTERTNNLGKAKFNKISLQHEYKLIIKKEGYESKWATFDLRISNGENSRITIQQIEVSLVPANPDSLASTLSPLPNIHFFFKANGDLTYTIPSEPSDSNCVYKTSKSCCTSYGYQFALMKELSAEELLMYKALIDSANTALTNQDYFIATEYLERALAYNDNDEIKKQIAKLCELARLQHISTSK